MKDKIIKITNSCDGIMYGDLLKMHNGENIIKAINENDLSNILFYELRDYIVSEEMDEYVKVTLEVPYKVLNKIVKKTKITRNKMYKI